MSQPLDENHLHQFIAPTTLLFYFNELWELWNTFSCHLITYVERGRGEYFAGFCSFHFRWHTTELAEGEEEEEEDEVEEEEEEQLEQLDDLDDQLEYSVDNESSLQPEVEHDMEQRQQSFYRLLHMSLIFRASHFNQS
ncbi:uncharacterized protein LOC26528564 [Drosophila mojavensis]|uniref:Uncharacterized protein n=1 Tax=Drosophila mojavensis TaxID=7230 RepID=A0A0Q9WXB2_DROMO|nr:uncharacterized protein LOC26528564 [Drosophila mojavensis]KRG00636.1 uncharacterized protein Dmoj_GI26923 [Drosophila mojavensis]